jgi:hypothetical protein
MVSVLKFSLTMSAVAISLRHHLAAPGALHVNGQAFLVAVEQRVEPCPTAQQLACTVPGQRLDLDDLGAQVGQHHAAGRAHDHVREFDDTDALQGKGFGFSLASLHYIHFCHE